MKKESYIVLIIVLVVIGVFVAGTRLYQKSSIEPQAELQKTEQRIAADLLIKDYSPSLGPVMARVQLVEFLDPECESCSAMHPIVKKVIKQYEGRIRYVVRYMPFHGNSQLAATWLEAAREQGKYWEALDALFLQQGSWASHHAPRPELLSTILKSVGVDINAAKIAKDNPVYLTRIAQDKADGNSVGVTGTPTFFVNGKMILELGEQSLVREIEAELNAK